jgi:NAD-dependent deacetylase
MTNSNIVVLTGAGISAESGVPTFRGAGGLWRGYRAQDLATPQAFNRDPHQVWAFYHFRRELVAGCQPNAAHIVLSQMETQIGAQFTLITQNVDGLHRMAGNSRLIEIHGSLWQIKCTSCDHSWEDREIYPEETLLTCDKCESLARPDVVWFGEGLDAGRMEASIKAAEQASIMLVIGTSALVYPAAQLPVLAKQNGARLYEFNPNPTPISDIAYGVFREPAASSIPQWWSSYTHE